MLVVGGRRALETAGVDARRAGEGVLRDPLRACGRQREHLGWELSSSRSRNGGTDIALVRSVDGGGVGGQVSSVGRVAGRPDRMLGTGDRNGGSAASPVV